MKTFVWCLVAVVCGLGVIASTAHAQNALGRIRVGAPFPDVELPALSDETRTGIKTFHGKPTILIVFASW